MLIIKHRINSIQDLMMVPNEFGVEFDLHFHLDTIYVGHDPYDLEIDFNTYLETCQNKFMAVNIKEEGIEELVLELLRKHGVENFFLFDLSFPSIVKLISRGESRVALRLSDFEDIRDIESFNGKAEWLWIDIFEDARFLSELNWRRLKSFKKCFVSPELHVSRDKLASLEIQNQMLEYVERMDAICTKNEDLWL
jgi:hypothetical protein